MNTMRHAAIAALIGTLLSVTAGGSASAQEIPTGAARIIENVETRIFISKSTLTFKVAAILENHPAIVGGE